MNSEFCLFQTDEKRVIWEVTNYCNYSCKHCCAEASKVNTKEELKLEDFKRILKQLKEFGIKEIYFSGGEPFSRKDIIKILQEAKDNGIRCNISTNGSLITREIAKKLKQLEINKVHISLDSSNKNEFDEFRGGNYFEKTIDAIKILKEQNIYVRVGTVIWKENAEKLEEMVKFLKELKVDEVVFNWLIKVGRLTKNSDVCVDNSEFGKITENINRLMEKYSKEIKISMHRNEKFCESEQICPAGEKFFYIDPNGYVAPCSWIKKLDSSYISKQSLKEKSFSEIINTEKFREFNQMKKQRNVEYKTGCPAICLERNKTYFSKDPLLLEEVE